MTADAKHIMNAALALPPDDRAELAEQLLRSLDETHPDPDVDAAWQEEIQRRVDEVNRGVATLIPADQAMELLRNRKKP
jgi:putative addiction module component (TIGR02574 family)